MYKVKLIINIHKKSLCFLYLR